MRLDLIETIDFKGMKIYEIRTEEQTLIEWFRDYQEAKKYFDKITTLTKYEKIIESKNL